MKKIGSILIIFNLIVVSVMLSACNRNKNSELQNPDMPVTDANVTELQKEEADKEKTVVEQVRTGSSVEIGDIDKTANTVTGRKALPLKDFSKFDISSKGLSTESIGYSFGVSRNSKPHSNSLNAQATLDKYGGLAVDLKSKEKVLYLTFDCGYEHEKLTLDILDVLKEKQVPATFFVTLSYLKDKENGGQEASIRMVNEGHIIGNHSATHPNFSKISREKMVEEIQKFDDYLRENYGYSSPFFRFPEGAYNVDALDLVRTIGYVSVFWSVAYSDWDTSSSKGKEYAVKTVTDRLHPGAVILLHSCSKDNAQALGDIIDWARNQGYTFVPLTHYN